MQKKNLFKDLYDTGYLAMTERKDTEYYSNARYFGAFIFVASPALAVASVVSAIGASQALFGAVMMSSTANFIMGATLCISVVGLPIAALTFAVGLGSVVAMCDIAKQKREQKSDKPAAPKDAKPAPAAALSRSIAKGFEKAADAVKKATAPKKAPENKNPPAPPAQ